MPRQLPVVVEWFTLGRRGRAAAARRRLFQLRRRRAAVLPVDGRRAVHEPR